MIATRRTPPLALAAVVALAALTACGVGGGDAGGDTAQVAASSAATPPTWTWTPDMVFPADTSLARPEDGVALPDGRLIVTDQVHGLRMIATDGSSAPFGDMVKAGYVHAPPKRAGGANGVSLEPDGKHLLVTDGHEGAIYRVDVESGAAARVYRHRYGVNTAVRDSRGAICAFCASLWSWNATWRAPVVVFSATSMLSSGAATHRWPFPSSSRLSAPTSANTVRSLTRPVARSTR